MLKLGKRGLSILLVGILSTSLIGCTKGESAANAQKKDEVKVEAKSEPLKKGEVKIQYLGVSAFVFGDSDGTRVGVDFYKRAAFPYPDDVPFEIVIPNDVKLNKLLISHEHDDHNYVPSGVDVIRGLTNTKVEESPELSKVGNIKIGRFKSEHFLPVKADPSLDAFLENAVFTLEIDGIRIVHMGDAHATMGNKKSLEELKQKIGKIDILLMPIGTPYTREVNPETLTTVLQVMDPKVTIPMHYWNMEDKEESLSNIAKAGYKVEKIEGNSKVFTAKDIQENGSKIIWNLPGGKFTK